MESIESLNKQLENIYGIDTMTGRVMYRIVFSDDQYEKRLTEYDDKGNPLFLPEVRELPKYRQWIQGKYILENLVYISNPEVERELAGQKLSYEPLFVFDDKDGNPLPPRFDVCQLVISALQAAKKGGGYVKYREGEATEEREKAIQKLQEDLFGNETDTSDALKYREGVTVPKNYGDN